MTLKTAAVQSLILVRQGAPAESWQMHHMLLCLSPSPCDPCLACHSTASHRVWEQLALHAMTCTTLDACSAMQPFTCDHTSSPL